MSKVKYQILTASVLLLGLFTLNCQKAPAALGTSSVTASASPTPNRNPQNDPQVRDGYNKHQQEHKEQQEQDKKQQDEQLEKSKNAKPDNYEVKKSGETARGSASPDPK